MTMKSSVYRLPSLDRMKRALLFLLLSCCAAWSAERPNIIVIVADDLGYGELGCYGGKDIPTPKIDSLAKEGVRFTNGYVTAPFCAASRAALLTGRWQTRFGFEFNPIGAANADPQIGLPKGERTLADAVRDQGYATALVGKWHLGGTAAYNPQRRGFDEFFGFLHEGHYYVPPPWEGVTTWLRRKALPDGGSGRWTSPDQRQIWSTAMGHNEPDYDADNPILRNSQPVDEKENLTDAFTREANSFIHRHAAQPFFLYLAYNAVHSPMQGADAEVAKFAHIPDVQRRIFASMLSQLDRSVGKVLDRVREEGLDERTLIVFLSDNGGPTKELTSSNAPLRGGKGELWEGGIRIPFLMRWKGRATAGSVCDAPAVSLDLSPTADALTGTKRNNLDGVDLLPLITGNVSALPERPLYWRVGKQAALREGDWKLVRAPGKGGTADWQLYHLKEDISETRNLAATEHQRVAAMKAKWEALNGEMVEPKW